MSCKPEVGGANQNCNDDNDEMEVSSHPENVDTFEFDKDRLRCNVIKPIDKKVVHRICSGQVIVTLATAVKELLENSIDAGATSIDIRLVEYGSKSIEVVDNGCGVAESNLEGLVLKHHTSKISSFEDVGSVETFGFRGEALSSLCCLSELTVFTKCDTKRLKPDDTASQERVNGLGFRIEYDPKGRIKKKSPFARAVGTTIVLKNLFYSLPVRHVEFLKNLKREFHRMVNVLYGYCLITTGVRITCTNKLESGVVSKVVSVLSSSSLKEKIVTLFGGKQFESLTLIKEVSALSESVRSDFGVTDSETVNPFTLHGYVSLPHKGRSSTDRQFFFINSRPYDPPKVSKLVNEVYHGYSRNQYPFIFLDIRTEQQDVDVNVTPDKRQIYLRNEKLLYASIKTTLLNILETAACSYASTGMDNTKLGANSIRDSQSQLKFEVIQSTSTKADNCDPISQDNTSSACTPDSCDASQPVALNRAIKTSFLQTEIRQTDFGSRKFSHRISTPRERKRVRLDETQSDDEEVESPTNSSANILHSIESATGLNWGIMPEKSALQDIERSDSDTDCVIVYDDELDEDAEEHKVILPSLNENETPCAVKLFGSSALVTINLADSVKLVLSMESSEESPRNEGRRFRAGITAAENETAEEELKKQLCKQMFPEMEVIGQFNHGFIITRHGPDLFIVDQHATDEKYNYEDLEANLILQSHQLIRPLDLQLPSVSKSVVRENIDVFRKNGFDFQTDQDDSVLMVKIPYSESTVFGKDDVEELIFLLEGAPEKAFYRPSKVRSMLASRACRKSVMIGTPLKSQEMRRLVDHMSIMNQPWNCPHGRPTIRHLVNLNMIPEMDVFKFNH